MNWLIERYKDEPQFFENCKAAAKTEYHAIHDIKDPTLLWLTEHMITEGLSPSATAKKLKVSAATVSRLCSGKYKGDVAAMLARIAKYREQVGSTAAG